MLVKDTKILCLFTLLAATSAASASAADLTSSLKAGVKPSLITDFKQMDTVSSATSFTYHDTCQVSDIRSTNYIVFKDNIDFSCGSGKQRFYYALHQNLPAQSDGLKYMCVDRNIGLGVRRNGYILPSGYIIGRRVSVSTTVCYTGMADGIILNQKPQMQGVGFSMPMDTELSYELIAASDPDGDPMTFALDPYASGDDETVENGATATLQRATNTQAYLSYTPKPGWSGVDQFSVRVSDNRWGSAVATVTIVVGGANQPPIFSQNMVDNVIPVNQDMPMVFGEIADDPDGDDTLITHVFEPLDNGVVERYGFDNTVGQLFKYTPNTGFYGQDRTTFTATDHFGASASFELIFNVRPTDNDQDNLPDSWETSVGLDPTDPTDATMDNDNDGLDNLGEYANQTDPQNADSDGDLIPDGYEVAYYSVLDPNNPDDAAEDGDSDNYSNYEEYVEGTDPTDPNDSPLNIGALIVIINYTLHH